MKQNTPDPTAKSVLKEQIVGFYENLPRFVDDCEIHLISNKYHPGVIEHFFAWNGHDYTLLIKPARLDGNSAPGQTTGDKFIFPGASEALLEKTLRYLAVGENVNFDNKRCLIKFSLSEIIRAFALINNTVVNGEQIAHSLDVLVGTEYLLKRKSNIYRFRTFNASHWRVDNNERHCLLYFTPIFLNHTPIYPGFFDD